MKIPLKSPTASALCDSLDSTIIGETDLATESIWPGADLAAASFTPSRANDTSLTHSEHIPPVALVKAPLPPS